jgi:hypothetical protein
MPILRVLSGMTRHRAACQELAIELMPKVEFDMDWQPRSIESIQIAVKQLEDQKKLKGPSDYGKYAYVIW